MSGCPSRVPWQVGAPACHCPRALGPTASANQSRGSGQDPLDPTPVAREDWRQQAGDGPGLLGVRGRGRAACCPSPTSSMRGNRRPLTSIAVAHLSCKVRDAEEVGVMDESPVALGLVVRLLAAAASTRPGISGMSALPPRQVV